MAVELNKARMIEPGTLESEGLTTGTGTKLQN